MKKIWNETRRKPNKVRKMEHTAAESPHSNFKCRTLILSHPAKDMWPTGHTHDDDS